MTREKAEICNRRRWKTELRKNFEDGTVLEVRTRSATHRKAGAVPLDLNAETGKTSDEEDDDQLEYDELEFDAIDIYKTVLLEADIDPKHHQDKEDADLNPTSASRVPSNPSSVLGVDVPMSVIITEIIAAKKTMSSYQQFSLQWIKKSGYSSKGRMMCFNFDIYQ